jgi:hypothetical protein
LQVVAPAVANELLGQGRQEKQKTASFRLGGRRVGHPEMPNPSLCVDVLQWYHPFESWNSKGCATRPFQISENSQGLIDKLDIVSPIDIEF